MYNLEIFLNRLITEPLLVIVTLVFLYLFIFSLFMIFREPTLWVLNFFKPDLVFKVRLSMAERGYYRYDGMAIFAKIRGYPVARVIYPDGEKTVEMAIGNALDLKCRFGGTVVPS